MAIKENSTLHRSSEVELHHKIQFSVVSKMHFCRGYIQQILSPTDRADFESKDWVTWCARRMVLGVFYMKNEETERSCTNGSVGGNFRVFWLVVKPLLGIPLRTLKMLAKSDILF